jgi:hypothetical protein
MYCCSLSNVPFEYNENRIETDKNCRKNIPGSGWLVSWFEFALFFLGYIEF